MANVSGQRWCSRWNRLGKKVRAQTNEQIKNCSQEVSIEQLCGWFGLTRQAYYQGKKREQRSVLNEELIVLLIMDTRKKAGQRLGTWKVFNEVSQNLKMMGIKIGRDRFYDIARCNVLLIKPKKRKRAETTDSSKWRRQFQNLRVDFIPTKPEQLWVSDITYIRVGNGFAYLSLITDTFSRQIMGWHLHQDLSTEGCLIALQRALAKRVYPSTELIHHSDRGCQYCSTRYVEVLKNAGINISMTQNGSPYENPLAESVNGQLKVEYDLDQIFESLPKARAEVLTTIQKYNEYRPHGSIQLRKPAEYHLNWKMEKSKAA